MPSEEYGVLVARAVPLSKPTASADSLQNVKIVKQPASVKGGVNSLSDSLNALQISKVVAAVAANAQSAASTNAASALGAKKQLQQRRSDAAISPADFVNLQSMRSSALARKTNTTSKFNRDCRNLFADLLAPSGGGAAVECAADAAEKRQLAVAKPQKPNVEFNVNVNNNNSTPIKKELVEKVVNSNESTPLPPQDDKEMSKAEAPALAEKDARKKVVQKENAKEEDEKAAAADDLLSRGPIRMGRTPTSGGYHPYDANTTTPTANNNYGSPAAMPYGAAPQSAVNDPSSYNTNAYTYGYDCGAQNGWLNATGSGGGCFADSRESTPDTVSSDLGYASAASPRFATHAGGGQFTTVADGYPSGGGRAVAELDDLCSTLRESDLTLLNSNNNNCSISNNNSSNQNGQGNNNNSNNTFVDNMQNSIGYTTGVSSPFSTSSASPPSITQHAYYYEHSATPSGGNGDVTSELPDALSDFILKYSRRYTPPDAEVSGSECSGRSPAQLSQNKQQQCKQQQQKTTTSGYYGAGSSASSSPLSGYSTGYGSGIESSFSSPKTASGDSQCNSPLGAAAGCLPPKGSPAAPRGGCGEHASPVAVTAVATAATTGGGEAAAQLLYSQQTRHAKERLRALIANDDMDKAWAWTLKCIKNYPGALCFQDSDGDTLLHIVTHHQDLAKIYALVEQLLKMELEAAESGNAAGAAAASQKKWFNAPNRCGETPLHLAVQHRQPAVVDYLLEAGASANTRNGRPERDAPLHYAAARGMHQMVETICGHSQTNVNLANGMGLTALLYAVKNHGVVDEEQPQQPIDNCGVIEALIRHQADPLIADATSGKTVIHYAVERLEVKLIEIFHANLPPHLMSALVNQRDLSGETPLYVLEEVSAAAVAAASPQPSAAAVPSSVTADSTADVEQLRSKMYLTLVACGAETAP